MVVAPATKQASAGMADGQPMGPPCVRQGGPAKPAQQATLSSHLVPGRRPAARSPAPAGYLRAPPRAVVRPGRRVCVKEGPADLVVGLHALGQADLPRPRKA